MSVPIELWKNWEGKLVDGTFPLRKWLGGSDHSAVFVTERTARAPQKTAIKLIPAESPSSSAQLARWTDAARLAHPHLIQLFEHGRTEIDGTPIFYVITELADENLAEVIPVRSLSSDEVIAVLRPAAEALQFLHNAGFVHGRIKPSNILAVGEQLKLSADSIRKVNEPEASLATRAYAAPEAGSVGFTPASDVWSLGLTLLTVSRQAEPKVGTGSARQVSIPQTLPQPVRGIIEHCVQTEPSKRPSASDILNQISGQRSQSDRDAVTSRTHPSKAKNESRISTLVPIGLVALLLLTWIGSRVFGHHSTPAPAVGIQTTQPDTKAEPAAPPATQAPPRTGLVRGTVRKQVSPDVSRSALHTITGRLKVVVRASVDAFGNVTTVKLTSPGPSAYFSTRAVAAARQWKFNPPLVNGQAAASEWLLRFQFTRSSAQVVPSEIKP
jgi:TonB family protein